MKINSTCSSCRGPMVVTRPGDPSDDHHPTCPEPRRRRLDDAAAELVALYAAEAIVSDDDNPKVRAQIAELEAEVARLENEPPRLKDAALAYVSWGWPVFPLRPVGTRCDGDDKCIKRGVCQCPKKPATPNGFKNATTDASKVDAYWSRYPDANIGLATGHMFDVLDIDAPEGTLLWSKLVAEGTLDRFEMEIHGQACTASAGLHLYIPHGSLTFDGKPLTGNRANFMGQTHWDYRGLGGYVVAPPSWLGVKGTSWSWMVKPSPAIRR